MTEQVLKPELQRREAGAQVLWWADLVLGTEPWPRAFWLTGLVLPPLSALPRAVSCCHGQASPVVAKKGPYAAPVAGLGGPPRPLLVPAAATQLSSKLAMLS